MNFIFIMSDSFRFDNLACYTQKRPRFQTPKGPVQTPCLDRFAERATIFERTYVGSYPTVQNRKDVFTGKMRPPNPWSPLEPDALTVWKVLRTGGYVCHSVQDTPHTVNKGFYFQRDFNSWDFIRGQESDPVATYRADQPGDAGKTRGAANWAQHSANIAITRRFEQDCLCAQTMTHAVQWLERYYNRGKFCLYVDTFDPHEPWDAPQWYEDMYDPGYKGVAYRYPIYGKASVYSKAELNHLRACYAGEASLVDRWIGFLLDTIKRMGLMENTCVIFTADHGICVGDHGWTGKNMPPMYEEIAHTPLLIHAPKQTKSLRVKALVQHCDLMPTILDLAGIKQPGGLDGVSLAPALKGRPLRTRSYAFSRASGAPAITSAEWSLVYPGAEKGKEGSGQPELYHLPSDLSQTKNVLKKNLPVARRMEEALEAWMPAGLGGGAKARPGHDGTPLS